MAKNQQAAAAVEKQQAKERTYLATDQDWDQLKGAEYGGQADILELGIGEVAGPFEYVGHQPMVMEGGKTVTVHLGLDRSDDTIRLPISASFLRAVDQAGLGKGDKFLIRRSDDVAKKAGLGKGQAMHIYALKIVSQIPRQQAPIAA